MAQDCHARTHGFSGGFAARIAAFDYSIIPLSNSDDIFVFHLHYLVCYHYMYFFTMFCL